MHFVIRTFNKSQEDSDAVKRFITYHFEEQLRNYPGQRIVILFDMTQTGLRHLVRGSPSNAVDALIALL